MTTGFCKKCGQNTLLRREDIDICLVIILAIFTAGVGLIIYLIMWYSKDENQCVHCGTIVSPVQTQNTNSEENSLYTYQQAIDEHRNPYRAAEQEINTDSKVSPIRIIGEKILYCPYCGVQLENNAEYCPDCGMKI